MVRKKQTQSIERGRAYLAPIGRQHDNPNSMYSYLQKHLDHMEQMNRGIGTVRTREFKLYSFIQWCHDRGLEEPQEITKPIVERYQRYLFYYRKVTGEPLAVSTQNNIMAGIRVFFSWLAKRNYILYNPASDIELPREPGRLPQNVLTTAEIEKILAQPDTSEALGVRDRAILETFYATGIRRAELAKLKWSDIDRERGVLFIREGKHHKDRYVPIGDDALKWVDLYLTHVRPGLSGYNDGGYLFLTKEGEPFKTECVGSLVRRAIKKSGVTKPGSCHLFRHAMATQMLENGADIRFIQAILGHSDMSTTEIYTRVSIKKVKEIHNATHPRKTLLQDSQMRPC